MMGDGRGGTPPAFSRWVLRMVVPREEVGVVEGEIVEGSRARTKEAGLKAARRWSRRQVWGYVWRAVAVHRSTRDEEWEGGMMPVVPRHR